VGRNLRTSALIWARLPSLRFTPHVPPCYPHYCHQDKSKLRTGVHQVSASQRAKEICH
jgi:hypothetical protein